MVIKFNDVAHETKMKYLECFIDTYENQKDYLHILNLITNLDDHKQEILGVYFLKRLFEKQHFSVIATELSGKLINWVT